MGDVVDLNGKSHLDAEAPTPEVAWMIRTETTQRLHGQALAMLLALIGGNQIPGQTYEKMIELLGGERKSSLVLP